MMAAAPDFSSKGKKVAGLDFSSKGESINLDTRSGADPRIRQLVGGAQKPEDKLATLKQFYPDAELYGEDNFIFTSPKTGKPTLYNPPGLDFGDYRSIVPEIYEFAGGVAGGAAAVPGAVVGAIPTAGASLMAIPAGVGLGAAAGREFENLVARQYGRVDTRGLSQQTIDAAKTAALNAVGQEAGRLAVVGGQKVAKEVGRRMFTKATPSEMGGAFTRQGITPTAGAVSGKRSVQMGEQVLSYTPGGAGVMQRATERTVNQTGARVQDIAGQIGSRSTPQEVGGLLRQGANEAGKRFAARREGLDEAIERTIGSNAIVPVANVEKLLTTLEAQLAGAPKSRTGDLGRAIMELRNVISDAKGGVIEFGQLRKIRTRIGADLDRPDISGYRPGESGAMAQVYGALKDDIVSAAKTLNDPTQVEAASKAIATHDRYVRMMRTINLPVLDELGRLKTDEQIFRWAVSQGKIGGTRIAQLRRNLRDKYGEPIWDEVVSTVISRMGMATPGKQGVPVELLGQGDTFSPSTFLTEFSKLSAEAKSALFGGTRYEGLRADLEDIVKITASLKDSEKMANFSNTARGLLFGTLFLGAGQLGAGNVSGAATTTGGAIVAPYIAARLITNPSFVKWLARAPARAGRNALSGHIGRLVVIARDAPEIKDEVEQYYNQLQALLGAPDAR